MVCFSKTTCSLRIDCVTLVHLCNSSSDYSGWHSSSRYRILLQEYLHNNIHHAWRHWCKQKRLSSPLWMNTVSLLGNFLITQLKNDRQESEWVKYVWGLHRILEWIMPGPWKWPFLLPDSLLWARECYDSILAIALHHWKGREIPGKIFSIRSYIPSS